MERNAICEKLKDYEVEIKPYDHFEQIIEDECYIPINKEQFSQINSVLGDIPFILKQAYDKEFYSNSYRVIFNKGLGELQRSAKNPGLFRANIVLPGTNNKVVGQAELEPLAINEAAKLGQMVTSIYAIASVITNQYYLTNINNNLESIFSDTSTIRRYLETQKKVEQLADHEFLLSCINNLDYITMDSIYKQSTLVLIQQIKIRNSANMKFYKNELINLVEQFSKKDKKTIIEDRLTEYCGLFPEYWFSVFQYLLSSFLEVYLVDITEEKYLVNRKNEMVEKIRLYQTDVENFNKKFGTYFSNAKALNSDPRVKAGMTILGMIGGYTVNGFSGIIAGKDIANEIYNSQSNEKEIEKTRFQNIMKEFSDVYYNCDRFFELVNDIDRINRISNYPVEMVILDDAPFLKISPLAQKELAIAKE